ncbi:hypothetical protein B296_00051078 [Ensete ventricosum]|uniref:Uncharacterized protein n=1 Tax=Ensete ventricosum TaxID=4639 RepID=A0A426YIJ3_ENSVE|nr:hypothetical protein B296_00051078 [Ensete ventricosum]
MIAAPIQGNTNRICMYIKKERTGVGTHSRGSFMNNCNNTGKERNGESKSLYLVLNLLPSSLVGDLVGDVVLAEGASSIDEEPFVDAGTVEMVFAGEFPQLRPIIIGREADAALLQLPNNSLFVELRLSGAPSELG